MPVDSRAPETTGLRDIELESLPDSEVYKLLSIAVQPRPIAWVSTVGADGVDNLAPFSFFNVASRTPPTLMFSIGERIGHPGRAKDTLINIEATGEFVVNIPARDHARAVTASHETVESDIDEFVLAAVEKRDSTKVRPKAVANALVSLECTLLQTLPIGTDTVVFGSVVAATVRGDAVDERLYSDPDAGLWLARLAGPYYSAVAGGVHQDDEVSEPRGADR